MAIDDPKTRQVKPTDEPAKEPTLAEVLLKFAQIQEENQRLQRERDEKHDALVAASQVIQAEQLKQTKTKSLKQGPKISAFNPRGEKDFPMPRLKCEFYLPWKWTPEDQASRPALSREEVELLNLLEPGDYQIELSDGAPQTVCVVGVKNTLTGKWEKLSLLGPKDDQGVHGGLFLKDTKQQFPSLVVMLRQMVGEPAEAVITMKREINLIASGTLAVSVGE